MDTEPTPPPLDRGVLADLSAEARPMAYLTWRDITTAVGDLAARWGGRIDIGGVYPVPRGGAVPGALVAQHLNLPLFEEPPPPDSQILVVDDLVDSGATWERLGRPERFDALFRKPHSPERVAPLAWERDEWLVFPWEQGTVESHGPTDAVTRLLEFIGEDPTREGLVDTPARVVKALGEMTAGLHVDPGRHLAATFPVDGYEGAVTVGPIPFVSMCEHHLLAFEGVATVTYQPTDRIVGLSKIPRMVLDFARRPQVQERLTQQIAECMVEATGCLWVDVEVTADHTCMRHRGVESVGETTTRARVERGPAIPPRGPIPPLNPDDWTP